MVNRMILVENEDVSLIGRPLVSQYDLVGGTGEKRKANSLAIDILIA